jgi:predicted DsbA family dithiol-disulfide isomerase
MPHTHEHKITVYHATAPTCTWSWGYEGVLNRLRLLYGDQIDMKILTGCVYTDYDEWLKEYELDFKGAQKWWDETEEIMGVSLAKLPTRNRIPQTVLPASLAVMAANLQGEEKGTRFTRALLRRYSVEGEDVTKKSTLLEAAKESELDTKRFQHDYANTKARTKELESQGEGFPEVSVGFYNLVLTDGHNTTVILDYAFDPTAAEEAIDYLSGGKLKKKNPTNIVGYLEEHGPAPEIEIERVFHLTPKQATEKLQTLERQKKIKTVKPNGIKLWSQT